jgi:hypothetical protein
MMWPHTQLSGVLSNLYLHSLPDVNGSHHPAPPPASRSARRRAAQTPVSAVPARRRRLADRTGGWAHGPHGHGGLCGCSWSPGDRGGREADRAEGGDDHRAAVHGGHRPTVIAGRRWREQPGSAPKGAPGTIALSCQETPSWAQRWLASTWGCGGSVPPQSRPEQDSEGPIACYERLGGLLKYYAR